jgi:hypothetical protein
MATTEGAAMTQYRSGDARRAFSLPFSGAVACLAFLFLASAARAQTQPDDSRVAPAVSATSAPEKSSQKKPAEPEDDDSRNELSASQIIAMAQENPEIIVELKSLQAERLQAKGLTVQAESISDEQFFSQVASSKELRAEITYFLLARGFIL